MIGPEIITSKTITLSFSPCPNDTFALCAMLEGHIPLRQPWHIELHDIETLNEQALTVNHQKEANFISKVSSGALSGLDHYFLLPCGMAYTEQAGPLLVVTPEAKFKDLSSLHLLSPGKHTTAFALAKTLLNLSSNVTHLRYDRVIPALKDSRADGGILIHEARFTYNDYGLIKKYDLGELWQNQKHLPLVLAGVVAHQSLHPSIIEDFIHDFRASLTWAWQNREKAILLAQKYAQEKDLLIVQAHIEHFVTQNTYEASLDCYKSLKTLDSCASPFHLRNRA